MKLKNLTPILAVIILAATSCKKESSETPSPIAGNWKFYSIASTSSATSTYTDAGDEIKIENIATFVSMTTKGVYKISNSAFTGDGSGYDYSGAMSLKQYENGVLQSQVNTPQNGTIAPSNSTSQYKLIGTDSIYFTNSAVGGTSSAPGGCKYKIEGNILSLIINQSTTATTNLGGGLTSTDKQNISVTVLLQKQ